MPAASPCPAVRHGTASARAKAGCTCRDALRDRKRYLVERARGQLRTVDATGTRRRLHALMAIGWSGRHLMTELGWPGAALGAQMYQGTRVYATTARRVTVLYDRLSATPGPSTHTRGRARRAGWAPPLAWDDDTIDDPHAQPAGIRTAPRLSARDHLVDEVAVHRAVAGDPPPAMTRAERLAAVTELRHRGLPEGTIAERIGVSPRQVHRDLTDLGLTHRARTEPASVGGNAHVTCAKDGHDGVPQPSRLAAPAPTLADPDEAAA